MSVDLWRWTPRCDGRPCVGDCDFCSYEPEEEEECTNVSTAENEQ